ncbi:MAG: molybdopterin-guanine dinucleotide biosynthesis protein B [Candidatus Thorarchaeota archaeon]|nr:molybdopterin-guanine dinucleotide biosynthesis protein B [Candidatus Thorarchaeota archaeon]
MRVFAVSGYSGTGKTTLVESLVRELTTRGYSVATVKSTKEEVADTEGSDTWRHHKAGAAATVLLSPHAVVTRRFSPLRLEDVIQEWDYDFVLVEGMKDAKLPKFWCVRDLPTEDVITKDVMAIVALSDSLQERSEENTKVLTMDDISLLADIVEQKAIRI